MGLPGSGMMRSKRWILTMATALCAACGGASGSDAEDRARISEMYETYRQDFPGVSSVSPAEVQRLQQREDVVLVGVRTPDEWNVSRIPGAVTLDEFNDDRSKYAESLVVAYCTIGARSGKFAAELQDEGFEVRNLKGSILAWTHAGGELDGPEGPTKRVHVYGRRWDLAADGYETVW